MCPTIHHNTEALATTLTAVPGADIRPALTAVFGPLPASGVVTHSATGTGRFDGTPLAPTVLGSERTHRYLDQSSSNPIGDTVLADESSYTDMAGPTWNGEAV